VIRSRLNDAVRSTAKGSACVVQAPPGYGASTLWDHLCEDPEVSCVRIAGNAVDVDAVLRSWAAAPFDWCVIDGVDEPAVLTTSVAELLDRLPGESRMAISAHVPVGVLVTRSPPATVLDRDDLRFTEAEAWALLMELVPAADPSLVAAVAEICEGWATALVFAADRVRRDPQHATRWLITHGPRLLVGSWFDGLAPELQDFLGKR
jgi:ATP/maltotriose-dependent transcriptional regulator MalT